MRLWVGVVHTAAVVAVVELSAWGLSLDEVADFDEIVNWSWGGDGALDSSNGCDEVGELHFES